MLSLAIALSKIVKLCSYKFTYWAFQLFAHDCPLSNQQAFGRFGKLTVSKVYDAFQITLNCNMLNVALSVKTFCQNQGKFC